MTPRRCTKSGGESGGVMRVPAAADGTRAGCCMQAAPLHPWGDLLRRDLLRRRDGAQAAPATVAAAAMAAAISTDPLLGRCYRYSISHRQCPGCFFRELSPSYLQAARPPPPLSASAGLTPLSTSFSSWRQSAGCRRRDLQGRRQQQRQAAAAAAAERPAPPTATASCRR